MKKLKPLDPKGPHFKPFAPGDLAPGKPGKAKPLPPRRPKTPVFGQIGPKRPKAPKVPKRAKKAKPFRSPQMSRPPHGPEKGMKAKDLFLFGVKTQQNFDSLGRPTTVVQSRPISGADTVQPGALVKGDFKHPNPWGYRYDKPIYQSGLYQTFWPDGKTIARIETGPITNGDTGAALVPAPRTDPNAVNKGIDKLYDRVRGGLDLSVDGFQIRQNLRMIGDVTKFENNLGGLYNWVGSLHGLSGKLRSAKVARDLAKALANKWLEYRYGWKPLIEDIYGIADENLRYCVNHTQNFKSSWTNHFSPSTATINVNGENVTGVLVQYEGKEFQRYVCDFLNFDRDLSRWASLNPISVAWELMPYSFAIDWFYNVGGYLRNMESALLYGNRFKGGYKCTGIFYSGHYQIPVVKSTNARFQNIVASRRNGVFSRSILSSAPMPYAPRITTDLGSGSLLNAAALLAQHIDPFKMPPIVPWGKGRPPFNWGDPGFNYR